MTIVEGTADAPGPEIASRPHSRDPRLRYELVPPVATLVLAGAELWAASFPVRAFSLALGAFLLGIAVLAFWLLQVLDRVIQRHIIGWARVLFVVLAVPVILASTVLILNTDLPLRTRLAFGDTDLRALATSDPTTPTVGTYEVIDFTRTDFGFRFTTNTNDTLFGGDCGLAYSPVVVPGQPDDVFSYEPIEGPWYRWCLDLVD